MPFCGETIPRFQNLICAPGVPSLFYRLGGAILPKVWRLPVLHRRAGDDMEKVSPAHTRQIAWLVSGFFMIWVSLAVASALPGNSWLHRLFSPACHQSPERSYHLLGHPVGLCVRCFWIYLGLALGHPAFAYLRISEKNSLRLLGSAGFLVVADVLLESLGLYENWKAIRALTGGLFGFACAWFTLRGLNELCFNPEPKRICHESN
jgi:uncharacterized membrane protein